MSMAALRQTEPRRLRESCGKSLQDPAAKHY